MRTWRQMRACKNPPMRPAALVAAVRARFQPLHGDAPCNIKKKSQGKQEDAHEFLIFLLNSLEENFLRVECPEIIDFLSRQTTPVGRIFGGWLVTECECTNCTQKSTTFSPFTNLSLCIEGQCDVQEALNLFFQKECIQYTCKTCSNEGMQIKQFMIHKAPSTMILQLQRFRLDRSKITSSIHINNSVKLPDGTVYDFAGAVGHLGETSTSGHYMCIAKCKDDCFRLFDDKNVTQIQNPTAIFSQSAYILMYHRVESLVYASPNKKSRFVVRSLDTLGNPPVIKTVSGTQKPRKNLFEVAPFVIKRSHQEKVSSRQSSHDYNSISQTQEISVCTPQKRQKPPAVPPLMIKRSHRENKVSSSQSSHDYNIISQTQEISACGTPQKSEKPPAVPPLMIKRSHRENKVSSSQSSHDYNILSQTQEISACTPQKRQKPPAVSPECKRLNDSFGECCPIPDYVRIDNLPSPIRVIHPEELFDSEGRYLLPDHPRRNAPAPFWENDDEGGENLDTLFPQDFSCGNEANENPTNCDIDCGKRSAENDEGAVVNDNEIENGDFCHDNEANENPTNCDIDCGKRSAENDEGAVVNDNEIENGDFCHDNEANENPTNCEIHCGNNAAETEEIANVIDIENANDYTTNDHASFNAPARKEFRPVNLLESEVPGAILPHRPISNNTVEILKRWLKCRGLPQKGYKSDLIERVALVMSKGNHKTLDPKVDNGKWYDAKVAALRTARAPPVQCQIMNSQEILSTQQTTHFPSSGWQSFPSTEIPSMFNYGHIYYYLVESKPTLPADGSDSDPDCSLENTFNVADPFEEEHRYLNEVQTLRKGLRYFKSNFVRSVEDVTEGRCYFVRAQVRASMNMTAHKVSVAISLRSGSVHNCKCECIQQSLGRCSHVSAVLLYLWSHIRLNGYGGKVSLGTCWSIVLLSIIRISGAGLPVSNHSPAFSSEVSWISPILFLVC